MAVRDRRESAYHELVVTRSASLFRTALLVVADHQLAQDLLQEALVKTYVAWPRLRDVGKAEAYTRRVVVTTAVSWRRRSSFHERPAEVLPEREVDDQSDDVVAGTDLWRHLQALPPRQRAAVALRYCQDLSEVQTAELMGCTVGSVKRHTSRGLAALRERMGDRLTVPASDEPAVTP